jgi:ABC-2 type transport system permease protein
MSALSTHPAVPAAGRGSQAGDGIPFARLARAELRKLTDTRASRWLLAAIAVATPVVLAVMLMVTAPRELTYSKLVDYTMTPQQLVLPALGILAITSEWSQRTGLITFTLVPGRRRVLLAKGTAAAALGLAVIAVAFGAAAVANLLGGLRHGNGSWALGAPGFGELVLVQQSSLLEGLAFGMLLRSSAVAIAVYYVLRNVWSLLFSATAGLKQVAPWVDLIKAQSRLYTHQINGTGWLQLLTAASIWILLPLAVGTVRFLRGEIKSA